MFENAAKPLGFSEKRPERIHPRTLFIASNRPQAHRLIRQPADTLRRLSARPCSNSQSTSSKRKPVIFEPESFEDRYENAVVEMIQRKRAGMPVPTERIAAPAPNVVSLMDALKRSLATEEAKSSEPAAKVKKGKKRAAGQREMLLPLAGRGTAKETAKDKTKEPARPATRQRKAG